jgi:hypothetical protein
MADREKMEEKERLLRRCAPRNENDLIVRVVSPFWDAKDGRDYQPGDVVVGWTAERAAWFAEQGLVEVIKTEDRGPMMGRLGPSEQKPGDGPVVRKEQK